MTPAEIGKIITLILWFFNFIMVRIARKADDQIEANFFLSLEIMSLGFMWLFFGMSENWW